MFEGGRMETVSSLLENVTDYTRHLLNSANPPSLPVRNRQPVFLLPSHV
jgi:hypothetical protein